MYDVYLDDVPVGTLTPDGRSLAFGYATDAALDAGGVPISVRLPRRGEPYGDADARPFFENLLPEAEFRRLLAAQLRLSGGNTAGLLGAIAGECAGAVSIWPISEQPPDRPSYHDISTDELRHLFAAPDDPALVEAQRRGRLSLAGVQPKLTVRRDGDRWLLGERGAATTHILKRTRVGAPYLVENEFFCMKLAAASGLDVSDVERVDAGVPLLAVQRFDRITDENGIHRVHQEDFCQATGTLPTAKYEAEGGPTLERCADVLLEHSSLPIADLRRLVGWVAFNYFVGNEDAHAKNLALLYGADGLRLAPFYDLVSTTVYKGLSRKSAMSIGGERRYAYVELRHWERLASALRVPWRAVRRAVTETGERMTVELDGVRGQAVAAFGEVSLLDDVVTGVRRRIEKALLYTSATGLSTQSRSGLPL